MSSPNILSSTVHTIQPEIYSNIADGRVKVRKAFDVTVGVTVRLLDEEYVCEGPHGLLVRASGTTQEGAIQKYLEAAADQMRANAESARRGDELVGLANQVREMLEINFILVEGEPRSEEETGV